MAKSSSTDLVGMMQEWFDKLPQLPKNIQEVLVMIAPWIALIFGIFGLVGGVAGLGLLTAFLPVAVLGGVSGYGGGYLAALALIASSALMLAAFPGLRAKKYNGWNLLFWSEVVSLVYSIVSLAIVSGIVGAFIGFYLLFQIKSYYK